MSETKSASVAIVREEAYAMGKFCTHACEEAYRDLGRTQEYNHL